MPQAVGNRRRKSLIRALFQNSSWNVSRSAFRRKVKGFEASRDFFPVFLFPFFFFLLFKTEFGSHGSKGRRRLSRCSRIHLTCSTIWDSLILKGSKKKTKNNLFLFGSKSVPGVTISKVSQDSVSVPNSMSTSRFVFQNQVPVSPSCPPR